MRVLRGPWSPTVTQHVAGAPTTDVYGNEVAVFTDKRLPVIAEYPSSSTAAVAASKEGDTPATGQVVTADRVLIVDPFVTISEYDEVTASDGLRYKVAGAPSRFKNPWTGTAVTEVHLRRIS